MKIDVRRLRYLLAVARSGGVVAAADELAVSPSGISQQIARLESEVGYAVLSRTSRGSDLTEEGRLLVSLARDIEESVAATLDRIAEGSTAPTGLFRLGAFESFVVSVVAPSLPTWRGRLPGAHIDVTEDNQEELLRAFRSGDLDAVVLELDSQERERRLPRGVVDVPLFDEPWKLVMPASLRGSTSWQDMVTDSSLPWLQVTKWSAAATALARVSSE